MDYVNCFQCLKQFIPREKSIHLWIGLNTYFFCSKECGRVYLEDLILEYEGRISDIRQQAIEGGIL